MEIEAQQAREALQAITRAEATARLHGPNNGTVPLVWGLAVLLTMVIFDAAPHLAGDFDIGMFVAGGCAGVIPLGAGIWTSLYRKRLPVQPRTLERPRLYFWWGVYHVIVVFGGTGIGALLAHLQHLRCLPLGTFTLIGLLDAAPLFWVGWQQRRACGGLR